MAGALTSKLQGNKPVFRGQLPQTASMYPCPPHHPAQADPQPRRQPPFLLPPAPRPRRSPGPVCSPGGPTSSTPLGGRAPDARNFSGLRKKSTTSISSTCRDRTQAKGRNTSLQRTACLSVKLTHSLQ